MTGWMSGNRAWKVELAVPGSLTSTVLCASVPSSPSSTLDAAHGHISAHAVQLIRWTAAAFPRPCLPTLTGSTSWR